MDEVFSCDMECALKPIFRPENFLDVPVIVITALNRTIGCEEKGLKGADCTNYVASKEAGLKLSLE